MDTEDTSESSQGTPAQPKIKRGIIWGNEETSALIKVWGEAEIKYALSSLKRNIEIFEVISSELGKLGFHRSASECRTKTKSLRKLYKQAVIHNNTSGSGRSKFVWYDEMANIFRTDTSIHPLRTTESESSAGTAMEAMRGVRENAATLILFEDADYDTHSFGPSETSGLDTQSTDGCEPSTSGCSSSQSTPPTVAESGLNRRSYETTNLEATLDPATRLALIRKRKQRTSAAARLDNTLSGFVEWVKESDQRKEVKMDKRDEEDILFQKEIINSLRVANTCLQRLTDYLTETPSGTTVGKLGCNNNYVQNNKKTASSSKSRGITLGTIEGISDSEGDTSNHADTGNSCEEDSDEEGSVSLLSEHSTTKGRVRHGTGRLLAKNAGRNGKGPIRMPVKHTPKNTGQVVLGQNENERSPYLIVKNEESLDDSQSFLRTPQKRRRMKKKFFSP